MLQNLDYKPTMAETLKSDALLLQATQPQLFQDIYEASGQDRTFVLHVEGYASTTHTILAVLRYAHLHGIKLLIVPACLDESKTSLQTPKDA